MTSRDGVDRGGTYGKICSGGGGGGGAHHFYIEVGDDQEDVDVIKCFILLMLFYLA